MTKHGLSLLVTRIGFMATCHLHFLPIPTRAPLATFSLMCQAYYVGTLQTSHDGHDSVSGQDRIHCLSAALLMSY